MMKRPVGHLFFLIFPILFLISCATILTGSTQEVYFNSEPSGGLVKINGANLGETPCALKLKKGKSYPVTIEKEGHITQHLYLSKDFQPIFLGNLILGGPLGMIVDLCSGAAYQLSPSHNYVVLKSHPQ